MAKNIEMSVLGSDGSYEVLYPYTIPSQVEDLLNNDTKIYIGLSENSTPDDAFRQLFLANVLQNKSSLRIILQNQDGIRMGGVTITSEQFCDSKGNKTPSMITNDEGIIDTFVDAESTTVNINGYFEIANTNTTWSTPLGEQLEETWTITTRNELTVTTTGNYSFSHNVKTFDACLVGGGGGGGAGGCYMPNSGDHDSGYGGGGGGGGGGYCNNFLAVSVVLNKMYQIIIGNGGKGGYQRRGKGSGENGGDGGISSVSYDGVIIGQVEGGKGGTGGKGIRDRDLQGLIEKEAFKALGGTGNGNGGNGNKSYKNATEGENCQNFYKFNDINQLLSCSGGGGGGGNGDEERYSLSGGKEYGGAGGFLENDSSLVSGCHGEKGKGYGGGGGGGNGFDSNSFDSDYYSGSGGDGYQGVAFLRWTVQEVSA